MGCSWSHQTKVKSPTPKHCLDETGQEVKDTEEEISFERKRPVRRWSQTSLDSAASLLSLDRVAAGHGGTSILKYVDKDAEEVPDRPKYVMKVWDDIEATAYRELKASSDRLLPFTPEFFGEVDRDDLAPELQSRYMRLANVLHGFGASPNVMDCKLGVRSFSEDEVHKTKLREDLYKKLEKLDPTAPTDEERKAKACTKYRWMSFNDAKTTLKSLGFRIDGIETLKGKSSKDELRQLQSLPELANTITEEFLPRPKGWETLSARETTNESLKDAQVPGTAEECDEKEEAAEMMKAAAEEVLKRLRAMREAMTASEFVRSHTFVGCSLLFVVDAHGSRAGVYLIDFAHTTPLPESMQVDHRKRWEAGNHEDGLLLGMDNIITCWERVLAGLGGMPLSVAQRAASTNTMMLQSI